MKTRKKKRISFNEEYLRANKKANREIELERNGGRLIAIDRPHKNKKKYDRKRDKRVNLEYPFHYVYIFY